MIVDLTQSFLEMAGSSRKPMLQGNWNASAFIKSCNGHLADLNQLDQKLTDLEKMMRAGGRFERNSLSAKFLNLKDHLRGCEQNIKRLKSQQVDIKSKKQMAQKLKESLLIAMELRLLTATFRFKDIHVTFAKMAPGKDSRSPQRQIALDRSHFLQPSQGQVLQEVATREYKQIEKSIHEISEMYRQTMHVVRMHQLLIDNITGYIDDTEENVMKGRQNLSQINSKEQKNRQFILKVFAVLYTVVFVYLVILN